jgi:hypothetical protein
MRDEDIKLGGDFGGRDDEHICLEGIGHASCEGVSQQLANKRSVKYGWYSKFYSEN